MVYADALSFGPIRAMRFGWAPRPWSPHLYVYAYYVDGLLIDTGQARARKAFLQQVAGLDVQQVFVTHHHEDHTGNLNILLDTVKCPAYASSKTVALMRLPPKLSLAQRLLWGDRPASHQLRPVGTHIHTPRYTFEVVSVPGHAPDMHALYEPNEGWLFSADLYMGSRISYMLRGERISEQIQSIERCLALNFDWLLCGHQPQRSSARERLAEKLDFLRGFQADVRSLHGQGYDVPAIMRTLRLREHWGVRMLSGGLLSKANMVRAALEVSCGGACRRAAQHG